MQDGLAGRKGKT